MMLVMQAGFVWAAEAMSSFDEANQSYRDGNYEEAARLYTRTLEENPDSGNLYYNLGNAYFRLNKLGLAILNYEKALHRSPRDADIRYNLNYARGLLEYKVEDKRNWYMKAVEAFLQYFRWEEVILGTLISYLLVVGSWVFVLFFANGLPWGWGRKALIVLFLISLIFLGAKNIERNMMRDAIVLEKNVSVHYGPSSADQVAFQMGEGLKVYVMDRREKWSRILLASGESGWVPSSQISEVVG